MSNSSQDDVSSRFRAIWVGLLALLSFGILTSFVVCKTAKDPDSADPVTEARAKARLEKLAEVRAVQEPLVNSADFVDEAAGTVRLPATAAAELVLPTLQAKKPVATQAVVPGSPTQIKQSAAPAPAEAPTEKAAPAAEEKTAAPKPASPAPAAEEKPAAPKPAAPQPAVEKPATAKPEPAKPTAPAPKPAPKPAPAPEKPAAKPAAPAPTPPAPAPEVAPAKPAAK